MRTVFADTSYYLALANEQDAAHPKAREALADRSLRVVTSSWVLLEIGDGLSNTSMRSKFSRVLAAIRDDQRTRILGFSTPVFDRAIALYLRRPDKHWSLTDCTSFVIMEERGIQHALTADHHFAQAGFKPLLA